MLRFSHRPRSVPGSRAGLRLAILLAALAALAATACGWRKQPAHDVAALSDPNATYAVVLETLQTEKYTILDQDLAGRAVRVRSHVEESNPAHLSVILLRVDGGAVHLSASGYLVRPDGTTHHALNSELSSLHKALQKKLGAGGQGPSSVAAAQPLAPVAAATLPVAWSETASNGRGTFTCLPNKLAVEEQTQLSLTLSNGETADVSLSVAYAPERCRSPVACKLPGGCPALGIADSERVLRLAGRLSRREIGPLALLVLRGQPIATIDLSKHGSIAEAMNQKH